jgi:hypothetical protein
MFSTGAFGRSILAPTTSPTPPSSANCTVIAIGYDEVKNQALLVSAGVLFSRCTSCRRTRLIASERLGLLQHLAHASI